jgi:predicted RNA-binding Zn-ribbon protein involved in translation (DUF1610 family)
VARSQKRHSISAEPHLQTEHFRCDASEEKAKKRLEHDAVSADLSEERAKHSVFDEPGTLPNRGSILIESDWYCRSCGYNLRGLMTGHRCPECGTVELYEPPREGEVTYAQWVAEKTRRASTPRTGLFALGLALAGLPCGAIGALLCVEYAGILNFVLIGPVVSELLKTAGAVILLERGSAFIRRSGHLYLLMIASVVGFVAGQNAVYLLLLYKNSVMELLVYRWMLGPVLHGICALVATRGLVLAWRRAQTEQRRITLATAYPYVLTAIVMHGAFNACVFLRGDRGYGF